jgi:transglutaminase-like putative cysteine protease
MRWLRPLPLSVTRPVSFAILLAWVGTMAFLAHRSYVQASSDGLAGDLARYGSGAQWRGVYYRGDKIGFTVSQATPVGDGFDLQEDGRLEMALLGSARSVEIRTAARVDRDFALRRFSFSLDPGTGPVEVEGVVEGKRLLLTIRTSTSSRTETRELTEAPTLALNLSRRLVDAGLKPGQRHQFTIFDPATLRNAPVVVTVGERELVSENAAAAFSSRGRVPAFRVQLDFAGLHTTSWITDTGEVVREESPMGMVSVRESPERARAKSAPPSVGRDLIDDAAVVPQGKHRILEPRDVQRIRLRLEGVPLADPALQGAGQRITGDIVELVDPRTLEPEPGDRLAARFLGPEPLIESDDPGIMQEAAAAVQHIRGDRARAERLLRHVHAIVEKKPTISLPSAREVLRTRVGDCNEHTALYVAMARALGIPARIAVGLTSMRGAFYYHAWPEIYISENGRGLWLPVDPTLNQFPADATHLRLARGGLDRQAAILPLIGRIKITILELELAPGAVTTVVGRRVRDMEPLSIAIPRRDDGGCWYSVPLR